MLGDRQHPALGAGAHRRVGNLLQVDHMGDTQDAPDHLAGCKADRVAQQRQQERAAELGVVGRAALAPKRIEARGRDTSQFMGRLLGIDVVNYDGEFSVEKQLRDLEEIATQQWDFVAIHPAAVNAYLDPVRALIDRGIPVIDMDTRLADDLVGLGVVTFLEPDNLWMGEQVTQAIIEAVQSQSFEIVHTQGQLTHTGAQGRARGFHKVIERYPGIRVVDETPGNWDTDETSTIWDDLLERYPNVRAGFCHNDDMALAALRSVRKAGKLDQVIIGGVDGMQPACAAVERGELVATAINPTGRIHGGAIWIGHFLATRGKLESVPKFIRMDGGIVNSENAAGYYWLGDHLLI